MHGNKENDGNPLHHKRWCSATECMVKKTKGRWCLSSTPSLFSLSAGAPKAAGVPGGALPCSRQGMADTARWSSWAGQSVPPLLGQALLVSCGRLRLEQRHPVSPCMAPQLRTETFGFPPGGPRCKKGTEEKGKKPKADSWAKTTPSKRIEFWCFQLFKDPRSWLWGLRETVTI